MTPRSPHETGPTPAPGAQGRVPAPEHPPLVLASRSPRRRELLEMLGLAFDVVPAEVDEEPGRGEPSTALAERLAREKALAVAEARPDAIVVGSDTIVVVDGDVLNKPADEADAVAMLLRLQDRVHRVETGVAVVAPGGRVAASVVGVDVRFRPLDRQRAAAYVATGEPMDKAGAYGIQGLGSALVAGIEGDFFAVMGLPIGRLLEHLAELGWCYDFEGLRPCR